MSYLLKIYVPHVIIVEAEIEIKNFKQPQNQTAVEYSKAFWTKAPDWGPGYDKYQLIETFMEGLTQFIKEIVHR